MPHTFTTAQVIERLEILWKKLEDEGLYVSANTVWLAMEEIRRLSVGFNPDLLPTVFPDSIATANDDEPC